MLSYTIHQICVLNTNFLHSSTYWWFLDVSVTLCSVKFLQLTARTDALCNLLPNRIPNADFTWRGESESLIYISLRHCATKLRLLDRTCFQIPVIFILQWLRGMWEWNVGFSFIRVRIILCSCRCRKGLMMAGRKWVCAAAAVSFYAMMRSIVPKKQSTGLVIINYLRQHQPQLPLIYIYWDFDKQKVVLIKKKRGCDSIRFDNQHIFFCKFIHDLHPQVKSDINFSLML